MNTEEIKHIRDLILADMLNGNDKTINGSILRKLDEQLTIPAFFRHIPTGHKGFFIKEYKPTGKPLTMQIKLLDNRILFAPKYEFERLSK